MNIFKTFEIFLREPLSILKERFIQIVSIQSNLFAQSSISADMLDRKTQITIVNSEKMYNLCQTALYNQKKKEEAQKTLQMELQGSLPQQKNQLVLGQLLKRE